MTLKRTKRRKKTHTHVRVRRKARKHLTALSLSLSLRWDPAASRYVVDSCSVSSPFRIN